MAHLSPFFTYFFPLYRFFTIFAINKLIKQNDKWLNTPTNRRITNTSFIKMESLYEPTWYRYNDRQRRTCEEDGGSPEETQGLYLTEVNLDLPLHLQ